MNNWVILQKCTGFWHRTKGYNCRRFKTKHCVLEAAASGVKQLADIVITSVIHTYLELDSLETLCGRAFLADLMAVWMALGCRQDYLTSHQPHQLTL